MNVREIDSEAIFEMYEVVKERSIQTLIEKGFSCVVLVRTEDGSLQIAFSRRDIDVHDVPPDSYVLFVDGTVVYKVDGKRFELQAPKVFGSLWTLILYVVLWLIPMLFVRTREVIPVLGLVPDAAEKKLVVTRTASRKNWTNWMNNMVNIVVTNDNNSRTVSVRNMMTFTSTNILRTFQMAIDFTVMDNARQIQNAQTMLNSLGQAKIESFLYREDSPFRVVVKEAAREMHAYISSALSDGTSDGKALALSDGTSDGKALALSDGTSSGNDIAAMPARQALAAYVDNPMSETDLQDSIEQVVNQYFRSNSVRNTKPWEEITMDIVFGLCLDACANYSESEIEAEILEQIRNTTDVLFKENGFLATAIGNMRNKQGIGWTSGDDTRLFWYILLDFVRYSVTNNLFYILLMVALYLDSAELSVRLGSMVVRSGMAAVRRATKLPSSDLNRNQTTRRRRAEVVARYLADKRRDNLRSESPVRPRSPTSPRRSQRRP